MATANSTPSRPPEAPGKLPYFELCERSGTYKIRRQVTPEQIITAAKAVLMHRCARGAEFRSTQVAMDYLVVHCGDKPSEVFTCLFLDTRNRLIAAEDLFHGTIDGASVYPREIARRRLELNAAVVILGHNHPSGVAEPSSADICITRKIKETLYLFHVRVLDHLVVGAGVAYSFADHGIL